MIRAFVGLPLPEHAADAMILGQAGLDVGRLVPRENFHLTLAFLGERPKPVLEDLHGLLDGISMPSITIHARGLDMFGGDRPRALFADVVPNDDLTRLRKRVRQAARHASIELDHERFRPHITLARFSPGMGPEERAALDGHISRRMHRVDATFTVDHFALFQSHLGRKGPHYDVLAEYPLS